MSHFPVKKIIFVFLASVFLFLLGEGKGVSGAESGRIPLEKVKALRVSETLKKFKKEIPPRDEFETREEYRRKVVRHIQNTHVTDDGSEPYFYVFVESAEFTYLADKSTGAFSGVPISKLDDGRYFLGTERSSSSSEYEAVNGFGAQTTVTKINSEYWGLFFENPSPDVDFAADGLETTWWKKMTVEEGKAIKNHCGAIIQFRFSPELVSEYDGACLEDFDYFKPTFDDPKELNLWRYGLPAKDVRLTFFNKKDGEIVLDIDFDSYKNEWTHQIEGKKERNRQKKMDHAQKANYFFMDWKTPKGMINAKYVKMHEKNVVLEDENGKQIEVPYDDLEERYQDLCELAKCFNGTKKKLQKERVWTYANRTKYVKSSISGSSQRRVPLTFRGSFESATAYTVTIKDSNGEFQVLRLDELSAKDIKWINKTYQVFTERLHEYEVKYDVHLLPPVQLEPETIDD